jgi:hypothetical protein
MWSFRVFFLIFGGRSQTGDGRRRKEVVKTAVQPDEKTGLGELKASLRLWS